MRADTIEKILEMCDEFTPGETPEYFFDRNYKKCTRNAFKLMSQYRVLNPNCSGVENLR